MNRFFRRTGILLVGAAMAAGTARAEDPTPGWGVAFKARAGYGLGKAQDQLSRKAFGMGFELGYGASLGRFGVELGYQYKPGNQGMADLGSMPTAPGATVDFTQSVDSRKNQLGGVTARLSFERPLPGMGFSWRAGLQLGGAKFRQEYIGDVTDGATYEDTYNGIVTKSTNALSPFVGLTFALDGDSALEVNLLGLAYTSARYTHVAGTVADPNGGHTAWDYVTTTKRTVPHLELCYVLRF